MISSSFYGGMRLSWSSRPGMKASACRSRSDGVGGRSPARTPPPCPRSPIPLRSCSIPAHRMTSCGQCGTCCSTRICETAWNGSATERASLFTWERTAPSTLDIYYEVRVGEPRRGRGGRMPPYAMTNPPVLLLAAFCRQPAEPRLVRTPAEAKAGRVEPKPKSKPFASHVNWPSGLSLGEGDLILRSLIAEGWSFTIRSGCRYSGFAVPEAARNRRHPGPLLA